MWDEALAANFFASFDEQVRALGDGAVPRISHETHRGRVLRCPFVTARLLKRIPKLQLTSDFSHWVILSERYVYTNMYTYILKYIHNCKYRLLADMDGDGVLLMCCSFVANRLLDTEYERSIIDNQMAHAMVHIHARVGTPQMPQVHVSSSSSYIHVYSSIHTCSCRDPPNVPGACILLLILRIYIYA